MKPKLVVLVVVMLLLAMVPALAMAKSEAKPSRTRIVRIDIRQPIGPQLDAQLGVGPRGPRSATMMVQGTRASVRPNAVYALLEDGFENGTGNWLFEEFGGSGVGWDATDYLSKRGQYSLYSAGYNNDPFSNPWYDNDMYSWASTYMDTQGARRVQIRFQHMSDTEEGWDYFYWCGSYDSFWYVCQAFTGSTNNKWKLVQLDSRNNPVAAEMLDSPFASFAFLFESDSLCCVDRGTFVDALRIRVWGPSPIQ